MNVISIIIGIIAMIVMIVGLIPLLGWLNWIAVVLCVLGIVFGAISKQKSGMAVSAAVLAISVLRLFLGGGFI